MLESAISYFTSWTSGVIGQSHLLAALIALAAGAWVLWARKGTRVHVAWGYAYLGSMVVLNGTALAKYDLTGGFNAFHAGALGSSLTLAGAFLAAMVYRRTRDRRAIAAHGQLMIWSYFGLVMALVAEVFTRAVPFMLHGEGGWGRFSIALTALMIATAIPTYLYARRERAKVIGFARG
ncbi:MAG: DUF2306 domain-containing protein [Pseudomonadota bacterium]|nr:DUF2306 domain-containing protein [Sphingomonas sp.]MDQ3478953.1 DUF2306 domain-containing protein [Pseudomonadota bacterium]